MKYALVLLLIVICGCGTRSQVETAPNKPSPTFADWIAEKNAKKEKCEGDEWRSSTNGYESWSNRCDDGVRVYSDTTQETQKWEAEINAHKAELADALVSRCLTAKEFKEVTKYGYLLYVQNMVSYREEDVQSRFNAALQTQQILRMNCPKGAR